MEDTSPIKHKPTSRVIDSLHSKIDDLKNELESVKSSHDNYKKNFTVVSKKNDLFVDQLANAKHENDMINALLKRKERRIIDLEDQYSELSSANESLTLNNKNMKIRCDNLQESSSSSIAEYERLKIAYDALIASQVEYKRHYEKELNNLTSKFELYKKQNLENFNNLSAKLTDNDKDIDTLVESLTNKRKTMDNLYVNKNKTVLDFLSKLAKIAKLHGQESKAILQDNVENIKMLVEKYPDLPMKLNALEETDLDLESVINESNDTLSYSSFDDDTTLTSSPDLLSDATFNSKTLSRGNSISMKKRKNKRNSIRFDSKHSSDFNNLHTQSNAPRRSASNNKTSRNTFSEINSRLPTPPSHNDHDTVKDIINANNISYQNQLQNNQRTNNRNSNNKSKRRSMYGNNNSNNGQKAGSRQNSLNKSFSEVSI